MLSFPHYQKCVILANHSQILRYPVFKRQVTSETSIGIANGSRLWGLISDQACSTLAWVLRQQELKSYTIATHCVMHPDSGIHIASHVKNSLVLKCLIWQIPEKLFWAPRSGIRRNTQLCIMTRNAPIISGSATDYICSARTIGGNT